MEFDELQSIYAGDDYYWGTDPNELAKRAVDLAPDRPEPVAIDVGAGEGRDAVYLAERGMEVTAVDVAPNGLAKAERLADERGVEIRTERGDVNELRIAEPVDVFYSIGTIQYLRPGNRHAQFDRFKEHTNPGGIHALFAFVDHEDVPPAPDWGENEHFYARDELLGYYADWDLLSDESFVFEDDSGGEPHRHAAREVIYRKPDGDS